MPDKQQREHWIMTTSAPCRAELHEFCEAQWCDCECHNKGKETQ
jgi:hypothetical protein